MAPFKLRFRMGGSRSTSQEADSEPPQQPLLNNITLAINGSNTTIDSEHNTDSYGSLNNDQRALIQNNSTGEQIGIFCVLFSFFPFFFLVMYLFGILLQNLLAFIESLFRYYIK